MIPRRGVVRGAVELLALVDEAGAAEVTGGVVFEEGATLYLVDGELYCAELEGSTDLVDLLVASGALTPSEARLLRRRGERMMSQATGVARAQVGLDRPVCHAAIRRLVEDVIVELARRDEATFHLDPYAVHPLNVVVSWPVPVVLAPVRLALRVARLSSSERRAGAAHRRPRRGPSRLSIVPEPEPEPEPGPAGAGSPDPRPWTAGAASGAGRAGAAADRHPRAQADGAHRHRPDVLGRTAPRASAGGDGEAPAEQGATGGQAGAGDPTTRKAALRRLIGAIRRL